MRLADLRGRRVAVWGTGREGSAAVRAIAAHAPADLVAVMDKPTFTATPWQGELATLAALRVGEDGHAALLAADLVVRSPGIGETHPWMIEVRDRGIAVTGGTALWMAQHAARTIGVTGTKGKSTTATLISHLLTALGQTNALGGNIGIPVLELPDAPQYVLELSMYQCADLADSPRIAALTSLYPEHLDWCRGGEEEYYRHKLNLIAHGPAHVVYPVGDERLAARLRHVPQAVAVGGRDSFHVTDDQHGTRVVALGCEALFPRAALPLVGRHNEANLCVALGVLAAAGVDCMARRADLADALRAFQPLEHRMTRIDDPSGITFVDDSISTIPQSAIHAIEAFADRPLTVIVGGENRGVDYSPLRDYLSRHGVTATLIGVPDSGAHILDVVKDVPTLTLRIAEDLLDAVQQARAITPPGGVVLLSPAAPSYGRYDNFEHRSRVFRQVIADTATPVEH